MKLYEIWLQHRRRGWLTSRIVTIHDNNGILCAVTVSQYQHWRRHFTEIFFKMLLAHLINLCLTWYDRVK